MIKNTAGQKWRVFAFNRTTNNPVTGDAANITAKISLDYGSLVALNDTNPTEAEDGFYYFDLTASETNANIVELFPESSTSGVQILGVPPRELPATISLSSGGGSSGSSGGGSSGSCGSSSLGNFSSQQLEQIRQQIIKSAGQPKSITVDGETFVQHGLTELLAAYRLAQSATVKKNSGIVFRKIVSSGAP